MANAVRQLLCTMRLQARHVQSLPPNAVRSITPVLTVAAAFTAFATTRRTTAIGPRCIARASQPWHGGYYYTQWGAPVALVIPPTAEMHTDYSWGVPSMRSIAERPSVPAGIPGGGAAYGGRYGFLPTPYYPSDTNQFGVYYVRGPW